MAAATQVYYWPREFVLRSYDFVQPRNYRRAAISIILVNHGQFTIEIEGAEAMSCAGLILGPQTKRQNLHLKGQDWADSGWVFDVAPGTAAHRGLLNHLKRQPVAEIPSSLLAALQQRLRAMGNSPVLALDQVRALHEQICRDIVGQEVSMACDERVVQAMAVLDRSTLDEMSIAAVAAEVGLSESRLRSLVRRELASNLAQYARWSAAWKTILHWQPGMTVTDAAHAAGFHDLAHANHAANDMFGMSPSRALNNERVAVFSERGQVL